MKHELSGHMNSSSALVRRTERWLLLGATEATGAHQRNYLGDVQKRQIKTKKMQLYTPLWQPQNYVCLYERTGTTLFS